MKAKRAFCLSIIPLVICFMLLSGCSKKTEDDTVVDQNTIIYKDAVEYDSAKVASILAEKPSIPQLQEQLEHISFKEYGVLYYTVVKTPDRLLLVTFYSDGSFMGTRKIVFSNPTSKKALEQIEIGDPINSVMRADEEGDYSFIYASYSEFPQVSFHFFEDGHCYEIHYKNGTVTDIYTFTI